MNATRIILKAVEMLQAVIDLQAYRLYNLTYDEVLLVEPGFAMPREEYEMQEAAKV